MMKFESVYHALSTLENLTVSPRVREEAARYLMNVDGRSGAETLVRELSNDDFGIRWEASNLLSKMGMPALPVMLSALTDPQRVADTRLREGIFHALQYSQDTEVRSLVQPLLKALKGPAADLKAMQEANRILIKLSSRR